VNAGGEFVPIGNAAAEKSGSQGFRETISDCVMLSGFPLFTSRPTNNRSVEDESILAPEAKGMNDLTSIAGKSPLTNSLFSGAGDTKAEAGAALILSAVKAESSSGRERPITFTATILNPYDV
jgi:hypothetical protein